MQVWVVEEFGRLVRVLFGRPKSSDGAKHVVGVDCNFRHGELMDVPSIWSVVAAAAADRHGRRGRLGVPWRKGSGGRVVWTGCSFPFETGNRPFSITEGLGITTVRV